MPKKAPSVTETVMKTLLQNRNTAAIILAAGNSTRMGKGRNKQMEKICGVPVLALSMRAYQRCALIRDIIVVTREEDLDAVYELAKVHKIDKLRQVVVGGATRQQSAEQGIKALTADVKYVAIADGARCLTTTEQIATVCLRAYRTKAAVAAHEVSDTVKRTNATGFVKETVDRKNLWQAQTPQVFHTSLYTAALYRAMEDGFEGTDDASLVEHLGYRVQMVECGRENIKITTPDDVSLAEAILSYRRTKK